MILKLCCKKISGGIIAKAHDNVRYIIMGFEAYSLLDFVIAKVLSLAGLFENAVLHKLTQEQNSGGLGDVECGFHIGAADRPVLAA